MEQGLLRVDDPTHQLDHIDSLDVHGRRMVFHTRKVKHLLHKARQTARLGCNRLEMLVIRRIHAILHSLYGGEHCHQRRTKLMGNVGGQTALMRCV